MPTYQYACTACGHELEAVQSFSDEPLTQCPACEGRLRKMFSAVGIVFKGSGFYRTDARNDSRRSAAGPRKKDAATAGSNESTSAAGAKELATAGAATSSTAASSSGSPGSTGGSGAASG